MMTVRSSPSRYPIRRNASVESSPTPRPHRRSIEWLFAFALAIGSALAASADDVVYTFDHVLTISGVGRATRGAMLTDAVEAQLVTGTWHAPVAGDTLAVGERTQTWTAVEANNAGGVDGRSMRGGYAFATYDSPRARIVLLDARGHRHVYVNGEPRGGDVYNYGLTCLPVQLVAGRNEFLFKGGRGEWRAQLIEAPAPLFFEHRDAILPDVVIGERGQLVAGVMITNANATWGRALRVVTKVRVEGDPSSTTFGLPSVDYLAPLPPISQRKCVLTLIAPSVTFGQRAVVEVELQDKQGERIDGGEFELRVRRPEDAQRRTFVSDIDGSVQYYGVTPMRRTEASPGRPALFLSLHGASVDAAHQAACYQPKDWGVVVAPTNRRRFGFDWEDWGRLDAFEALAAASAVYAPDPTRIYLTGHSMGGHGTWNIGAQFPDRFAAIGASAGWRDFWSYGGAAAWDDPGLVERLLARAANPSRTLDLRDNLSQHAIYVLHGDHDQTVDVEQARFMRRQLAEFHTNWAYYEQPGAGHWWGNRCMDWPPMFEFFRHSAIPTDESMRHVRFQTMNPGISADCHWLTIATQVHSLARSTVDAKLDVDQRRFDLTTDNVAVVEFDLEELSRPRSRDGQSAATLTAGEALAFVIDGEALTVPWPQAGAKRVRFRRATKGWRLDLGDLTASKNPLRSGTFKDAFRHRVQFVYGTGGNSEENAWAFAKARFDAETFQMRGNGAIEIVSDREFEPRDDPHRNVILYGHSRMNAAWSATLGDAPIVATRDAVGIGERRIVGPGHALIAIYPRVGSLTASVGIVAGTDISGMRLTNQLPYFVSGAGFPDWLIYSTSMLETGSLGIVSAGFFDQNWSIDAADAAWRPTRP